MSEQAKFLNSVVATEIINVLSPLQHNINSAIEHIVSSQNPYLTISDVEYLNSLSVDSVGALNELIINPKLGFLNGDHITLIRFNSLNSSNRIYVDTPIYEKTFSPKNVNNLTRVPYAALFLENFINFNCESKKLIPHVYTVNDISSFVIENLTTISKIINNIIQNYQSL
jgi:hypothetical protein